MVGGSRLMTGRTPRELARIKKTNNLRRAALEVQHANVENHLLGGASANNRRRQVYSMTHDGLFTEVFKGSDVKRVARLRQTRARDLLKARKLGARAKALLRRP